MNTEHKMENLSLGFKVLIEEVRWEIKKILQHTKNSLYSVFLRYETINCSRAMDQTHNGTQGVVKKSLKQLKWGEGERDRNPNAVREWMRENGTIYEK